MEFMHLFSIGKPLEVRGSICICAYACRRRRWNKHETAKLILVDCERESIRCGPVGILHPVESCSEKNKPIRKQVPSGEDNAKLLIRMKTLAVVNRFTAHHIDVGAVDQRTSTTSIEWKMRDERRFFFPHFMEISFTRFIRAHRRDNMGFYRDILFAIEIPCSTRVSNGDLFVCVVLWRGAETFLRV